MLRPIACCGAPWVTISVTGPPVPPEPPGRHNLVDHEGWRLAPACAIQVHTSTTATLCAANQLATLAQ